MVQSLSTGSSDSATLVGKLKAGDPQAWPRFCRLYGPLVYRWARRAGLQDSDAADVVQNVFQVVAQQIKEFRRSGASNSFRGWLWGITRHKILDEFRRRSARPELAGEASLDELALNETPLDSDLSEELAALVRRALALLQTDFQPATWQMFEQVVLSQRPAGVVAAEMGVSLGSVYTAKCRVLARLREELGDLLPSQPE